jgi:hypothetical protein
MENFVKGFEEELEKIGVGKLIGKLPLLSSLRLLNPVKSVRAASAMKAMRAGAKVTPQDKKAVRWAMERMPENLRKRVGDMTVEEFAKSPLGSRFAGTVGRRAAAGVALPTGAVGIGGAATYKATRE